MDAGAPDKWEYDYTFMIIGVVFMTLGITTNIVFFFCGITFMILGFVAFNDKKEAAKNEAEKEISSTELTLSKDHDTKIDE
jgi:uncharacterized membrane protein